MLTDNQILRIASLKLDDLHAAEQIEEGLHAVNADIAFHLHGTVEQKPVQSITPTASIPLLAVLALVGERSGIKADKIYDLIVDAALEAAARGEPMGEWIEHSKRALAHVKEKLIERLPRVTRSGQLRRIVELSEISVAGASLSPPPKKRKRA
jgi:hypothetical protein